MLRWVALFVMLLCPLYAASANTGSQLYAGLVLRANDGKVMYQRFADEPRHPASLTKMMTLYMLFDALHNGRVHMHTKLPVSAYAARQPPSNMALRSGNSITVREAIYALIIKSANDVAVVVAEALGGNESRFVNLMNKRAVQLGMRNTRFMNSHGWHHPAQVTTARDMAKLALSLRKNHRQYFALFSKQSFTFRGRVIHTHNRVMQRYKWADGLKTGYIKASGFNLVTTTHRPEGDLVAVVMGGSSARARDDHMIALLDQTYDRLSPTRTTMAQNTLNSSSRGEVEYAEIDERTSGDAEIIQPQRRDAFLPLQQRVAEVTESTLADNKVSSTIDKSNGTVKNRNKVAKKSAPQANKIIASIGKTKHKMVVQRQSVQVRHTGMVK